MPRSKKLLLCFISLIVIFFAGAVIDLACGPEPDPYDYYVSFFRNNVQKNDGYRSFYFNGYLFLNDQTEQTSESYINAKEWAKYIGYDVKAEDVGYIFYGLDRKTDSIYFRTHSNSEKLLPDSLRENQFIKALDKNKSALAYFRMIKETEPFVTRSFDEWKVAPKNGSAYHAFALACLKQGQKQKDRFLKLRYFYQAQRLLRYGGYPQEASDVYDKYIKEFPSASHIKGWALSIQAGAEQYCGHKEKAALLFAQVFANYPERRVQAYRDYHAIKVPAENLIKMASGKREKAFIYAINGFHNPHIGLASLKKVYNTDPKSELVSLLLVREINKIEEGYLTPRINGSKYYGSIGYWNHAQYDSVKDNFVTYIPKLRAFCDQIAKQGQYAEPALGNLASAYLSWIQGNTKKGFESIDSLKSKKIGTKLYDQEQFIRLLLLSQSITKLDDSTENVLLPSLTWLDKKVKSEIHLKKPFQDGWGDYDFKYFAPSSRDFYIKVLAPIYLKQQDTAKAALCILRGEKTIIPTGEWDVNKPYGFDMPAFWQNYLRPVHIRTIVGWQKGRNKSPYMRLLMSEINKKMMYSIDHIWGTACLREHKYNTAVKMFSRIPHVKKPKKKDDYWSEVYAFLPVDPFVESLNDYPQRYLHIDKPGYTQLTFAKTMARLQVKVKSDPRNSAKYYFKIATGLYNISYHGPAWYFSSYRWAAADVGRKPIYYYDTDYIQTRSAEKYYLKARQLSSDLEFKARCTFMAAKCRQKRVVHPPYPDYYDYSNEKELDKQYKIYDRKVDLYQEKFQRNIYFTDLQQNYSTTKFYKLAVNECSYLRDFLSPEPIKTPTKLRVIVIDKNTSH